MPHNNSTDNKAGGEREGEGLEGLSIVAHMDLSVLLHLQYLQSAHMHICLVPVRHAVEYFELYHILWSMHTYAHAVVQCAYPYVHVPWPDIWSH